MNDYEQAYRTGDQTSACIIVEEINGKGVAKTMIRVHPYYKEIRRLLLDPPFVGQENKPEFPFITVAGGKGPVLAAIGKLVGCFELKSG